MINSRLKKLNFLLAMIFSFFGSLFMMRLRLWPKRLLGLGMLFFAMAHVTYAQGFSSRLYGEELRHVGPGYIAGFFIFFSLVIVTLCIIIFSKGKINKGLFLAFMVYASVLGYNMMKIWGYSVASTGYSLYFLPAVGVTMFLASDCLIAIREMLSVKNKEINRGIWLLYVLGQSLMLIG